MGETTGIARNPAELRSLTGELIKKAFKLKGREAATVLHAIDSNPGRFADKVYGTIVVNLRGKGWYEYHFVRADNDEIWFLKKTKVDD